MNRYFPITYDGWYCGWTGHILGDLCVIRVLPDSKWYTIPKATEDPKSVFWNTLAYTRLRRAGKTIVVER
jgi:hypothetical protein